MQTLTNTAFAIRQGSENNQPKRRKSDPTIKYLTQKELERFFKAIKDSNNKFWLRDLTAFTIIYLCGLRASELQYITLESYNPNAKEIHIKRLKGSISNTIRIIQPDKIRLIERFIKEYTGSKLYQINNTSDPMFKGKNGKPLDLEALRYLMKMYGSIAKLPKDKQHPHILKHSIAVHLAESGIDVKDLQYYLGHRNINNTTIYFQYTTKQMDSFYNKLKLNNELV